MLTKIDTIYYRIYESAGRSGEERSIEIKDSFKGVDGRVC